ncbi:hypothetical protein WJ970_34555 [Achromobacter xylosoxidans]
MKVSANANPDEAANRESGRIMWTALHSKNHSQESLNIGAPAGLNLRCAHLVPRLARRSSRAEAGIALSIKRRRQGALPTGPPRLARLRRVLEDPRFQARRRAATAAWSG